MRLVKTTILALTLATAGCSTTTDFKQAGKEPLKNPSGHVIGYKERLDAGGEELDRVVLFRPRLSERGRVIAYEERIKGGVVLWDLRGKRIGSQYVDSRSRGTNPHSGGLTIVFVPKEAERLAQPAVQIAQVTIEEIKQHLNIEN
jgi:hypothetical protein